MEKRPIGNTGVAVTPIMFGTSGLGNMPDTYRIAKRGSISAAGLTLALHSSPSKRP